MDLNNTGGDPTQDNVNHPRAYAFSGKIVLSTIVVLFTVVLLILFLHLYVRWHVFRRHTRHRRRRLIFTTEDQRPSSSAPRGLDPEVLNSLSVLPYSAKDSCDDVAECAVCLSEFQEGEKVRCLPRCNHRFHIECIDMWFFSHNTCPLCRSAVEVESATPDAADSPAPVPEESSPPLPPHLHADLCFRCRMDGEDNLIGSSSSDSASWELSIELPRRGEGLRSLEEELVLESTSGHGVKSSGIRILSIKRFLNRDQRLIRDGGSEGETDLERGEGAERVSPPSAPPRPLPSSAE